MSRFYSYINTAFKLIETFKGEKPFATYLKQFFAGEKKYGAKDRRQISALCYNYFRIGFAGSVMPPDQRMLAATFLCDTEPSELLAKLQPEWNAMITRPLYEKVACIEPAFILNDIFPFNDNLSDGIDAGEFCTSFLVQPHLYIRIRPQTKTTVLKKLDRSTLSRQLIGDDCVQLSASENVEEIFIVGKEVVVQDLNSQKVLDYFRNSGIQSFQATVNSKLNLKVWDCCAASGGKSILLHDTIRTKIDLTVSDIRPGIILNLHQRFKKAGIKEYTYFIADLTSDSFSPGKTGFDIIICDAPCTGSGTWGRTPEQLCFFKSPSIDEYSSLQKKIITKVLPHLEPGGLFVYITCSVFKKENEEIAEFISQKFNCKLIYLQLLKGYDKRADNMFVAVFQKPY